MLFRREYTTLPATASSSAVVGIVYHMGVIATRGQLRCNYAATVTLEYSELYGIAEPGDEH